MTNSNLNFPVLTTPDKIHANKKQLRVVLAIAGSDPSGGAGIQADLKTFSTLGVYGCAAITALTAQNTLGVEACLPVDPDFFRKQVQLVLNDMPVSHIKIGMVGSREIAAVIDDLLDFFPGEVIYDPVLRASDGHSLFAQENFEPLLVHVVGRATVLTPNLHELELLTGMSCLNRVEMTHAVQSLLVRFPRLRSVVVTGGHIHEDQKTVTDFLINRKLAIQTTAHPRIRTENSHGTGCTFASAFAAFHLLSGDDDHSFRQAVSFVAQLLKKSASWKLGRGNGPLVHHLYRLDALQILN